jgi:hypothetical protein
VQAILGEPWAVDLGFAGDIGVISLQSAHRYLQATTEDLLSPFQRFDIGRLRISHLEIETFRFLGVWRKWPSHQDPTTRF